ncbi:AAA family ATPase [Streptomyces canus]|uniref:AAA family ATPase n=1 Tax=Streptomyces canus TaxID=58343 RepID=UPI00371F6D43
MSLGLRVERLPQTAAADAGQHPVVVGRARQLREITGLLGQGSAAGRALLLSGEPGVGKSALLGEVARVMSGAGARVLSAVGVRSESELAYAGLHQLLLPLNDRIERLEDTHRRVLRSALGYGGDPVPDGLHVSDAVLVLLRQAATERPVFIVVDDLGCFDRASSAVLGFVARRPAGSCIGLLAACRSGAETFFDRAGFTEYELPPLDRDAAVELLGVRFPGLAGPARERVLAQAQGNPLALVELPAALSGPQRDAPTDLHDVLPLSPRLRSRHAARVAHLPAESRRLLLLLALDDTGDPGVLRAGSDDSKALMALSAVESDRLITFDDTNRRFVFRHPLMRAAVVEASTLTERCQAHRTLAEIRAQAPERRAWHLGRATLVPDERVAALLEEAGHRAARRGDATAAVATFTRAAELSPRPADRGRRLIRAAYLAADATGELRAASELLDRARCADPDLTGSLTAATRVLLLLNGGDGDIDMAHRLLVEAIETGSHGYDAGDDALIETLHVLQLVCWSAGRDALWRPFHAALDRLKPAAPPLLAACGRTWRDPAGTGSVGRHDLAPVRLDRLTEPRDVSWDAVRRGRRGGHVRRHIDALMDLCLQDFPAGRWEEAETLAAEGLTICEERQYPFFSWYFEYYQALLAAVRGQFEESRSTADRITQWAVPRGVLAAAAFADHARVLAELGAGDGECAYRHAVAISPAGRLAPHAPYALWVCMDLVEAAVHTRRTAEAEAHVRAMREAGVAALSPRLALLVAGSAALVAPDDGAVGCFEQALALPGAQEWRFDLARIRLAYGERLRRMRFVTEARAQLAAAAEVFERLGARPWADRATGELRATRRSRTGPKHGSVTLTGQEQEIAVLAASGLTNKQIGERLHLSPRTVGSHLYQLFPKLGIASRAGLRDALASFPGSNAF